VTALTWATDAAPVVHAAAQASPVAQAQGARNFMPVVVGAPPPLCRFGVNGALGNYDIRPLRLGWFVDYQATLSIDTLVGIDYFPMIRLEEIRGEYRYSIFHGRLETTEEQLKAAIAAHPGAYWFIGNEPDRKVAQDDLRPHVYARAYHDLYALIKSEDPTAKIVAGAIVQPTPIRLQYLDLVLESYYQQYRQAMPVDVWAFHNFVLNEASCSYYSKIYPGDVLEICWGADIPPGLPEEIVDGLRISVDQNDDIELFKEQVIRFREWLADRGYQDTPVFLSEYGVLMPYDWYPQFDPARVNAFMDATFDFLLNTKDPEIGFPGDDYRLVQRFSWYSVDDNVDHNGALFDRNKPVNAARTPMGDNLAQYTATQRGEVDLYPRAVRLLGSPSVKGQGKVTVTVEALIANSGNLAVQRTAAVRFYNGDPARGGSPIGEAVTVDLAGCGEQATVQIEWANVAAGEYQLYVQVDGSNFLAETNETNNTTSAPVSVADEQLLIPGLNNAPSFP
jgi:hypothetical protein